MDLEPSFIALPVDVGFTRVGAGAAGSGAAALLGSLLPISGEEEEMEFAEEPWPPNPVMARG